MNIKQIIEELEFITFNIEKDKQITNKEPLLGEINRLINRAKKGTSDGNYIPFDLSKKEDRDQIITKTIFSKAYQFTVNLDVQYSASCDKWFVRNLVSNQVFSSNQLLSNFVFEDGTPCGKETEK